MNIEEEIARQNREIENSLAKMTESINAQMNRMMEATNPLKLQRAKKEEPEDNESEEIVKGQIKWDDIEDWNCTFVYEYERKGKAVSMRVDLINTDELFLALNDVPLSEEQEPRDYKKIDIILKNSMAFGDTISSISSTICCNGKRYHAVETEEHGRKKFMNCYLYEYNKKRELYNEIASLC